MYGSGYYDRGSGWQERLARLPEAERAAWLKYLDAGRRAQAITANYFVAAATNDRYYWPPAVQATLDSIRGAKNQLYAPNAVRSAPVPGGTRPLTEVAATWLDMEVNYFAYQLKGAGQPFPTITIEGHAHPSPQGISVHFKVQSMMPVPSVNVYYSTSDKSWTERTWIMVRAISHGGGRYEAVLPPAAVAQGVDWFALASDTRPVSVSSSIARVKIP